CEAEPGIAVVRNRALEFALAGFDFLAFLDDDELASERWLAELARVQAATDADAVIGPVTPEYPPHAPAWIAGGGFFELPTFEDGAAVEMGWTGNCLIRMATVRRLGLRFNLSFGLTGGCDSLFFAELLRAGGSVRYAAHADVREPVPSKRLTARYVLFRRVRIGNTLARCDRIVTPTPRAFVRRTILSSLTILSGLLRVGPLALRGGKRGAMFAARDVAAGLGVLAGLAGVVVTEYKRR
ncbi:MAG: glycosyl transferase family 2, partial [Candidatus Eremiobacteraeota bacterium]|nr:glycosyl transferase family 2 [Candidatus Eremiobacteraeota bacterium]